MINEPIRSVKKPSGCWWQSGCLLTVGSVLVILLAVYLIIDAERHLDKRRAEYAESTKEYEEAVNAYEADSAYFHAQYDRIQKAIDAAALRHDSMQIAALEDSLRLYAEPEYNPRGAIGFNIAGAFYAFFIIIMLIPLFLGIVLLLYYWYRKRKYRRESAGFLPSEFVE